MVEQDWPKKGILTNGRLGLHKNIVYEQMVDQNSEDKKMGVERMVDQDW